MKKHLRACGWLIALVASSGACATDFELTTPQADVAIALGGSADVLLTLANNTDATSPALALSANSVIAQQYAYALQESPGCGPLTYDAGAFVVAINTLAIAPIPAHGQRTCTLRATRGGSGFDNAEHMWTVANTPSYVQPIFLHLGTFVDMELTSERVSQDVSAAGVHSVFRLHMRNGSSIPVDPRANINECRSSLALDADLPGACPIEEGYCSVSDGGPSAIVFPRVAPGATGECLVGVTTGLWDAFGQMAYVGSLLDPSTGGAIDSNNANDGVLLSTSLPPVSLNQYGLSGSWANPDMQSQGIVMSVQPDFYGAGHALLFGGWFTYDVFASGDLRWYTLQGQVDGTSANIPIYRTRNGRLDSAQPTLTTPTGSATIRFADCSYGELAYSIADTSSGLPRTGTVSLTRLLPNVGCTPAGETNMPPAAYAMSGVWADTGTQGQGLVVDIDTHQNVLFAAWYTYSAQANVNDIGGQRWFTLQASLASAGATEVSDIGLYESHGGRFNAAHPATTLPVGTAHFTLHSCSSATLVYQFAAGSNAGSSGSLALTRLGAAPPGCTL